MMEGNGNISIRENITPTIQDGFFEDAEGLNNWLLSANNGSATITFDNTASYEGSKSVKMTTGPTMAATDDLSVGTHYAVMGRSKYVELIVKWNIEDLNEQEIVFFVIETLEDAILTDFYIILDTSTKSLIYLDSTATPVVINDNEEIVSGYAWNQWRIVVDRVNRKFVQVEVGARKYDLSGISGIVDEFGGGDSIDVSAGIHTLENANKTLRFDNLIVRGIDQP
jgi:hypothetical protein